MNIAQVSIALNSKTHQERQVVLSVVRRSVCMKSALEDESRESTYSVETQHRVLSHIRAEIGLWWLARYMRNGRRVNDSEIYRLQASDREREDASEDARVIRV